MSWYLEVLKKYAVFSGRARRMEYWMFILFNIIITVVLALAASKDFSETPGIERGPRLQQSPSPTMLRRLE